MASVLARNPPVSEHPFTVVAGADASHAATIVLDGEVDLACADALRTVLAEQRATGRRHVRVDAAAVTFVDASILTVLHDAHQGFLAGGGTLVLAEAPACVHRLLRLTGLDQFLFMADTPRPVASIRSMRRRRMRSGTVRTVRPALPTT
jgi:anti-anti-sigma factor